MRYLCLFVLLSLHLFNPTASKHVDCKYEYFTFEFVDKTYFCDVRNDLNIKTFQSAHIFGATGNHQNDKRNDNVAGFRAEEKNTKYFPRGIEYFFRNISVIIVSHGRLKEIHQMDLKPFPKLVYLDLYQNDIEVLESGLFNFNPELAVISFSGNKIYLIANYIFDNLEKLTYLWLDSNPCIDMKAKNNSTALKEVVKQVHVRCNGEKASSEVNEEKIEESSKKLAILEDDVENLKTSCSQNSHKIETFQSSNIEAFHKINEKIDKSLGSSGMKNFEDMERKLNKAVEKIENLEKALSGIQEIFQTFQNEVSANTQKLMENLNEESQNDDRKIENIKENFKESQEEAFKVLSDKIEELEKRLNLEKSENSEK